MKEVIVLSIGGSVVIPEDIDVAFLKRLKNFVKKYSKKYKFIIVIGGGKVCRNYQNALQAIIGKDNLALDWMGISVTFVNAFLVKVALGVKSPVVSNPTKKVKFDSVLIASGWKPGVSTDYDMVLHAKTYRVKRIVNMSNVSYLYDKDPNKYKSAKKIELIDWKGFRKIVGNKWKPGLNAPFDPIAAKLADKLGLELVLIGNKINNLKNYIDGKKFKGSIVKS